MRVFKFRIYFPNFGRYAHLHEYQDHLMDVSNGKLCFNMDEVVNEEVNMEYYAESGYILEQFTGLKDRHGKEIYEGDIVDLAFGIPTTIVRLKIEWVENEYNGDGTHFCGWFLRAIDGGHSAPLAKCYEDDIEIIDNIHERENE